MLIPKMSLYEAGKKLLWTLINELESFLVEMKDFFENFDFGEGKC